MTEAETAYLASHKLGRLATVGADGTPHVVPVMYAYADGALWISSDPADVKVRNIRTNPRAALVVDEPPPAKSGVLVRGPSGVLDTGEGFERAQDHLQAAGAAGSKRKAPGEQVYIRITPERVASWRV